MAKMSTIAKVSEQRVIVYGPPKVGKTELFGKLSEHYNLLLFSLENGHSTLAKLPMEWQGRIEVINIRDSRTYPIAIETMMKVIKGDEVFICVAHSKVACPVCKKTNAPTERVCLKELDASWIVGIDSLTQLTNSGIAHITKNQPDDYKLQLDDWGALKVLMDKFLSQVQVAPYNIVCISHEEEVKFEDGRTKIVPVAGSSNSSRNTAKYFDHVVYCNVVNKKHVVGSATDYSMSVLTGSRTDVKLEASKEGASLLDMFTTWKLPNYGMPDRTDAGNAEKVVAASVSLDSISPTRDAAHQIQAEKIAGGEEFVVLDAAALAKLNPGQRAIYNMKLKKHNEGVTQ
jgi:hypothetical protein